MSDARTLQTGRYAIDHIRKPVTVYFHDDIIASTDHALLVREESAEPIYYIPKDRVHTAFFVDSDRGGVPEAKGQARFWTISAMNRAGQDAAWAYTDPVDELSAVRDHIAFDPTQVRVEVGGPPAGAVEETL